MKAVRRLVERAPWVVLGVALGAGGVWSVGKFTPPPAPNATPSPTGGTAPETRSILVGRLLAQIRPDMTRQEVEDLLGPPDRDDPRQITTLWRPNQDGQQATAVCPYVIYYASRPDLPPGDHLMTVVYDRQGLDARVLEVTGPHVPD